MHAPARTSQPRAATHHECHKPDAIAGHAYGRDGAGLRPSGLPDGVQTVTFASDGLTGWALAGYGTCGTGKQGCHYHHDLLTTTDGGAAWSAAATRSHEIS